MLPCVNLMTQKNKNKTAFFLLPKVVFLCARRVQRFLWEFGHEYPPTFNPGPVGGSQQPKDLYLAFFYLELSAKNGSSYNSWKKNPH